VISQPASRVGLILNSPRTVVSLVWSLEKFKYKYTVLQFTLNLTHRCRLRCAHNFTCICSRDPTRHGPLRRSALACTVASSGSCSASSAIVIG